MDLRLRTDINALRGFVRISTEGLVASQRLRATFCWFPPESTSAGAKIEGVLIPKRRVYSTAIFFFRTKSNEP